MIPIHRLELWLTIKLLSKRLKRQLYELNHCPDKWVHYRDELIKEINELKYLLSGLWNEWNND